MSVDTPAPVPSPRSTLTAVTGAIRKAAQTTGASFDYLLAAAKVESNLNPDLSMRSSSATGLFQFIEQTWLEVMKQAGKTLGFGRYADAITETKSGRYEVSDPAMRAEIMQLRKDPAANATLGGVFTQQNAAILAQRLGRKPTDGELYIAHFFGPYSAAKVIGAAVSDPTANAAQMFPAAAHANGSIFYDRQGNARSVAGVYRELVHRYQVARASPTPGLTRTATATSPAAKFPVSAPKPQVLPEDDSAFSATVASVDPAPDPAGVTQAYAAAAVPPSPLVRRPRHSESGSMFVSLFQTGDRRGAVSSAVTELWNASHPRLRGTADDGTQATAFAPTDESSDAADPSPLDLFQDMPPRVRDLFEGSK